MKRFGVHAGWALALLVGAALAAVPALAVRPAADDGGYKQEKKGKGQARNRDKSAARPPARPVGADERYFDDQRRVAIRDYYGAQFKAGRCPPGLAKKRNDCMPPGQAKKWQIGRPLPRDVVFHDLPPTVIAQIGPPPAGHRFVRIAADILLIAVGTGMVIDAIEDLGRM
jgi:Ni/Co efflux regulator RcnB